MDSFRFLPPCLPSLSALLVSALSLATAMPSPQGSQRFLPGLFGPAPTLNQNQGVQNTLAGAGIGAVGGIAATQCLFGGNCDLSFRPSLGASVNANGQIKPQLGITTQVGKGDFAPTFTGGLQLDNTQQNGVSTFVGAGVNNGDPNSISPGIQTGFEFTQNEAGQTQATSQLGGNIQAPSLAGVNFGANNKPGNVGGVQPTLFNQPLLTLFGR